MSKKLKKLNNKKKSNVAGTLAPSKGLGQNFLVDEEVIEQIVLGSEIDGHSLVIEIGPGTGVLTCPMAETAGKVIAVEIDERLIEPLRVKTFSYGNVEIINEDILKVNLNEIINENLANTDLNNVRIVGNLPYYITTPIIMKLLEMKTKANSITVMIQKEVGERISATPGTKLSGPITYGTHYYAEVSKIVDVDRESFYPIPNVDSMVLKFTILAERPVNPKNEKLFFSCIKAGFSQRRKTLLNSMMTLDGYSKEDVVKALRKTGIETNRRAETLSMQEFADLSDAILEG